MSIFDKLTHSDKLQIPSADQALPGRAASLEITNQHFLKDTPLKGPFPDNLQCAYFAFGCFWGAERKFWQVDGVYTTAVGYTAGFTPNPSYEEVCSGRTGHAEVVLVVFDPLVVNYEQLLATFWESHNPTQGMRQGNDKGTQYRSGLYVVDEAQKLAAEFSRDQYQSLLVESGFEPITTEILMASDFYYAEDYHQQYLAKNPGGYCGLSSAAESGRPQYSC
jgi:peptide-methionine (S)-S-oxide reductase